jgi:DNA topoisomerase-1
MDGIRRLRSGRGFRYVTADRAPVRDRETLERIRSLAIPPAWKEVWISPFADGHIQATGRDARGRKQYRYHPRWCEVRDESKYGRLISFGEALPSLRARVTRDLALPGMPREKVLAAVIRLLDATYQRIGNPEYARRNGSYGLTTLRNRHAAVKGSAVRLQFRGKGGKMVEVDLDDHRVAAVVRRSKDLPGYQLFCYVGDDGGVHDVGSGDVNQYLREISGDEFTAKDFRTWAGTLLAAGALRGARERSARKTLERNVVTAIKEVAESLGNTPAVCRKHYVHPAVVASYLEGTLERAFTRRTREARTGLRAEEVALMRFLRNPPAVTNEAVRKKRNGPRRIR